MDIDGQTKQAIEMVSQGARLTGNLITFLFSTLANRLEKNGEKALIDSQSREGKQKINDLLRKHKDGIETLDENLTKQQVKEYQKEFKKLGVDFSIVKNEKDNYSLFFAGGQASVIQRGLENVVELNNKVMNNDKVKEAELELNSEMKDTSEIEIDNVNKAYDQYINRIEGNEEIPERENLTEKEKVLFDKTKDYHDVESEVRENILDEMELEYFSDLSDEQHELVNNVFDDYVSHVEKGELSEDFSHSDTLTDKEQELFDKLKSDYEKENILIESKDQSKEILNNKLSELSDEELELFEKKMEYENEATSPTSDSIETYRLADELKEIQGKHSKETIDKINNLDKEFKDLDNFSEKSKGNKLNANEILRETKNHSSERSNERSSERNNDKKKFFSVENVKNQDKKIREESKDKDKVKKKEQSL